MEILFSPALNWCVLYLPLIVILPIRMLASQLQLVPQHIAIAPDEQDIY